MIDFAGAFINPYMISFVRVEHTDTDVALHVHMTCGAELVERYDTAEQAKATLMELSEIIDPTMLLGLGDEDDDDTDEEAQDFRW